MPLTQAERAKRYREKLKQNAEKYEEQRKKQIERVKKRQKKINELSDSEKVQRRKIWREQKKKQREANKQAEQTEMAVAVAPSALGEKPRTFNYKTKYKNLFNKYNSVVKQLIKIRVKNQRMRKNVNRSNQRYQREIQEITEENDKVKARLEIMEIALGQSYKESKTHNQKRVLRSIAKTNVVFKNKGAKTAVSKSLGLKSGIRFSHKYINNKIREEMDVFFNRDDISRSTSGKRECRTKNKKKMQIRYLTDTLSNLHQIYKSEDGKYSFSTFCKYRPFYILSPTHASRDTCLCVKHSNFSNLVTALKKHAVFPIMPLKGTKELLELVSCDIKSQSCMYSKCHTCKNKKIYFEGNKNTEVEWWQWERTKKTYKKNDEDITANVTKKEKRKGTVQELIDEFEKQVPLFKKHFFNMQEQQRQYRMCIENLKSNECAILIDFSENYDCKLSQEIQSLHFGGSKNSITLHTGMIYLETQCQSFVTLSDNNCHEPHAIWAHLIPIIKLAKQMCPNLSVIHFFSDGPSSQYRQKKNFFLFNLFTTQFKISLSTWSFSESGHGKGVADGIGGATKRALDRRVFYGHDISNATDAHNNLKACLQSIKPFFIPDSDIDNIKTLIPNSLKVVTGTLQIHQIISKTQNAIFHRQLSCFCNRGLCDCHNPTKHNFLQNNPNIGACDNGTLHAPKKSEIEHTVTETNDGCLSHDHHLPRIIISDIPENTTQNITSLTETISCVRAPNAFNKFEIDYTMTESETDPLCHDRELPSSMFSDVPENTTQNITTEITSDDLVRDVPNKSEIDYIMIESEAAFLRHDRELPRIMFSDASEYTKQTITYPTETTSCTLAPDASNKSEIHYVITESKADSFCHDSELPSIMFAEIPENTTQNITYPTEATSCVLAPDVPNKSEILVDYNITTAPEADSHCHDRELPLIMFAEQQKNKVSVGKLIPKNKRIKVISDVQLPPIKKVKTMRPTLSKPLKPIIINRMSHRTFYCIFCKSSKPYKLQEMICCLTCKTWSCLSCSGPINSESYVCANCIKR